VDPSGIFLTTILSEKRGGASPIIIIHIEKKKRATLISLAS
jgi:hypothetical protein